MRLTVPMSSPKTQCHSPRTLLSWIEQQNEKRQIGYGAAWIDRREARRVKEQKADRLGFNCKNSLGLDRSIDKAYLRLLLALTEGALDLARVQRLTLGERGQTQLSSRRLGARLARVRRFVGDVGDFGRRQVMLPRVDEDAQRCGADVHHLENEFTLNYYWNNQQIDWQRILKICHKSVNKKIIETAIRSKSLEAIQSFYKSNCSGVSSRHLNVYMEWVQKILFKSCFYQRCGFKGKRETRPFEEKLWGSGETFFRSQSFEVRSLWNQAGCVTWSFKNSSNCYFNGRRQSKARGSGEGQHVWSSLVDISLLVESHFFLVRYRYIFKPAIRSEWSFYSVLVFCYLLKGGTCIFSLFYERDAELTGTLLSVFLP